MRFLAWWYFRKAKKQLKKNTMYAMKRYEQKLVELLGEDGFEEFCTEVARQMFMAEIIGMKNGEFKTFCLEHFEEVTK